MTTECQTHPGHSHTHGPGCGHTPIQHEDHTDYLHDGHLHHPHGDHVDDHELPLTATHPAACTPQHACGQHDARHVHGPGCGHEAVPHAGHTDYLVKDHLHHPHGPHCDDHGRIER
jgi:hypothetical protein